MLKRSRRVGWRRVHERSVLFLAMALSHVVLATAAGSPWNPFPVRGAHVFSVRDFGAKGDNKTLDTLSIQKALNAAAVSVTGAAAAGDPAYVRVPAGGYLIGTVNLSSNVYLVLEKGAVLQGSANPADYAFDSDQWNVVQAQNATNTGVIAPMDGEMGGEIRGSMWQMIAGWDPQENHFLQKNWKGANGCDSDCRPMNLAFTDSVNISVVGVRIMDSAFWTQLFRRCSNVMERNVHVEGATQYGNNDGLDIESCENVTVADSVFITGDDCIAMRSGNCQKLRDPWPLDPVTGRIQPTRRVRLSNLTLRSTSAAIKVESLFQKNHGDLHDVEARNIRIVHTNRGIGVWQRNGNGTLRDLLFENISIETEMQSQPNFWGSGEPMYVTSFPCDEPSSKVGLTGIKNVTFSHVVARSEGSALFASYPGPKPQPFSGRGAVDGLMLRNVSIAIAQIGNSTSRGGYHDFKPLWGDYAPNGPEIQAPVDGIFVDGAHGTFEDVHVAFDGNAKQHPNWTMQCFNATTRSRISVVGGAIGCRNRSSAV